MHKVLLALAVAGALLGCGGGKSGEGSSVAPAASAPVGPLGVVEDRSAGLMGVDANANGLRDDVDALILRDYAASPAVTRAARQAARSVQALLTASTAAEARAAGIALGRANNCVGLELQTVQALAVRATMAIRLEALTVNTRERLRAYTSAASLLKGSHLGLGEGPFCE